MMYQRTTLCLKKRHPFYFCDIFVKVHPILLIFGRNMPQEIWNKHMYMLNSCKN